MKKYYVLIVGALLCFPCYASKVIGVLDGDTLDVMENGSPLRIRLANVDAPEKTQAFGQASKKSLSDMCYGKEAIVHVTGMEQTIREKKRTIAIVQCGGIDVNRAQVERGLAWVYTRYNHDVTLPLLQLQAKNGHIGLWHDVDPVPPWDYRHKKTGLVATDVSDCLVGPRGGRFRIVDGKKQYGCA
ncbi:MAG: thermonuclease family protein [bacterium]|nr:thermonuclease family protein [bacterium]